MRTKYERYRGPFLYKEFIYLALWSRTLPARNCQLQGIKKYGTVPVEIFAERSCSENGRHL